MNQVFFFFKENKTKQKKTQGPLHNDYRHKKMENGFFFLKKKKKNYIKILKKDYMSFMGLNHHLPFHTSVQIVAILKKKKKKGEKEK